ncbi:hypothetical protein QZH41_019350, partial [Actinostola sp. cb2023]
SEKELVFKNGDYLLSWKYDSSSSEFTFKVTVKGTGWIGLGFSDTNSGMKAMDVVIANVSAGNGQVEDYHSMTTTKPTKDSQQDYTLVSATQTNGSTVVEFKRKLKTGDEKDIEIVLLFLFSASAMNVFHFSELIFLTFVACTFAERLSLNGGNYIVEWTYSVLVRQEIEFNITAKTTGWVGLGITKENTGMKKMDVFIGGYDNNNGSGYLKDYYADGTVKPTADTKQDLTIISASEKNGMTNIRFRRQLDTGDTAQDHAIKPDKSYYIAWAFQSTPGPLGFVFTCSDIQLYNIYCACACAYACVVRFHSDITSDYYADGTSKPAEDSQQDATIISGDESNGKTKIRFKRKLVTGDTTKDIAIQELTFKNGDYSLNWKYDSSSSEVTFKVTVKGTGWIGLGISDTNSGMKAMDVVIANVSAGNGQVEDYYSTATTKPTKPTKDSQQDYTLINATQTNGKTVVVFKRKLKTGDEKDIEIVPGKSYYIAWAFQSTPGPLSYHGNQLRGYSADKVVLAGASSTEKPTTTAASVSCSSVVLLWALAVALIVR